MKNKIKIMCVQGFCVNIIIIIIIIVSLLWSKAEKDPHLGSYTQ